MRGASRCLRNGRQADGWRSLSYRFLIALSLLAAIAVVASAAPTRVSAQTPGTQNADEDGSGDISAGDTLTYEISARNTGSVTLTNVTISDQLSGDTTTCATLSAGSACTLIATYVVTAADMQRGQLSTNATATSDQTGTVPLPAPATLYLPVPTVQIAVEDPAYADLDGSGTVSAGDTLTYQIAASNTGTANLTNVVVTSKLLSGTSGTRCTLVLPGASCTAAGVYVLTAADAQRVTLEDSATINSDQTGAQTQPVPLQLPQTPALALIKMGVLDEGPDGLATPGDLMSLTYSVTNTGNVPVNSVVVNDASAGVANCPIGTLAPGAVDAASCNTTYALTQTDIDAGSVGAEAVASGQALGRVVSGTSEAGGASLSIQQVPGLEVNRSLTANADEDGSKSVSAGDSVTFEVKATNSGNIGLTNVIVGDRLTGDETSCSSVAPLSSCSLTLHYQVTAANVTGGIPNLSYAKSDQTGDVAPVQPVAEVAGARYVPPANFLIQTPGFSGISTNVQVVGTNVTLALIAVLTLLVATTVFNSTIEENAREIDTFVRRISGSPRAAPAFAALGWISEEEAGGKSQWLNLAKPGIIVLATAVIYAVLDPNFGFNNDTLVLVCALIAGLAVSTFLYEGGQVLWATKRYDTPAAMRVYPLAIVIAMVCVALTRLTNLHPGIIFGFVTAAAIFPRGEMAKDADGKIIAVPLGALMLSSFVAFLLIDPLHRFTVSNASVFASLPETIAVSVFVGGAGSALLTLIPVTFNDGEKIWAWSKLVWFGLALPATFAFIHVMVNDQDYGTIAHDTSAIALVVICVIVLAITVATWLFFRIHRPEHAT